MTPDEMAKRFKQMIEILDLDEDEAMGLAGQLLQADKDAKRLGIAFKGAGQQLRPTNYVDDLGMPLAAPARDARGNRLR